MIPWTRNMTQTATYWAPLMNDGYGGKTFDVPVTIRCRWQDIAVLFRDTESRELTSQSIVYPNQQLASRGYLALGDHTGGVPLLSNLLLLDPLAALLPHLGNMWQDTVGVTPVDTAGQTVRRWLDQSEHEFALSGASGPIWRSSGGLRWLEFTSPNNLLVSFGANFSQPIHRFTAFRFDTWSAGSVIIQGGPGSDIGLSMFGADGLVMNGVVGSNGFPSNTPCVIEERYNGANSQLYLNGTLMASGSIVGPVSDRLAFNAGPNMRVFGNFTFNAIQANDDVEEIYAYLNSQMDLATGFITDPRTLPDAFEIRQAQQSPSLDGTRVLHKVFL